MFSLVLVFCCAVGPCREKRLKSEVLESLPVRSSTLGAIECTMVEPGIEDQVRLRSNLGISDRSHKPRLNALHVSCDPRVALVAIASHLHRGFPEQLCAIDRTICDRSHTGMCLSALTAIERTLDMAAYLILPINRTFCLFCNLCLEDTSRRLWELGLPCLAILCSFKRQSLYSLI